MIVDVAPHDREDFRRRFAHARLGFSDDLVLRWLADASLKARVVTHLKGELTIAIWKGERASKKGLRAVA